MANLKGVITAMLTPFDAKGNVMLNAIPDFVRYQTENGVNGLFVCGSTGLFPLMRVEERKMMAEEVVKYAKGKMQVIVQVGAPDTATSIELAKHAEKVGADGVASVPPYYYHHNDEALKLHYKKIADSVSIPLYVYNIPRFVGVNVGLGLLKQLADAKIVSGMKDSSRDFLQLVEIIENMPDDFAVVNGTEGYILPALLAGASGMVAALGNAFPDLLVHLYNTYSKDLKGAKRLQNMINRAKTITDKFPISSLYEVARERKVDYGYPRPPFTVISKTERERMIKELKAIKLIQ
ncbi:MAG: dihydrodipicolinate synthase family protein [Conexivisphaerales archaeon]